MRSSNKVVNILGDEVPRKVDPFTARLQAVACALDLLEPGVNSLHVGGDGLSGAHPGARRSNRARAEYEVRLRAGQGRWFESNGGVIVNKTETNSWILSCSINRGQAD
jgi:hypothetical protein